MHLVRSAILYTALALGANAAMASDAGPSIASLEALRDGDMVKLRFLKEPATVPDTAFVDAAGAEHRLSDWQGKYVLVNFWATWCAPCRAEMPSLDRLQAELGGDGFEVVTIATGRNPLPAIEKFFAEEGITHLPVLRDPRQELARDMAVMGLPISLILDPEGREIARLIGDAHWDGDSAKAIISALMAGS